MGPYGGISGLYEFHICALCRKASQRGLFAKIPSLPLLTRIIFFQSLSKIHDRRLVPEQRPKPTTVRCAIRLTQNCIYFVLNHVSNSLFCVLSLVNTTPRCFNLSTHCRWPVGPFQLSFARPGSNL